MSLPFLLTLVRVVMSPVFLVVYLYYEKIGLSFTALPYVLLGLVALCEITDFFDGFVARRRNKVTDLGKILDPMADSIFRLSVFFTLTQGIIQLPLLAALIFFFRDSIISSLRTLCALRGVTLAARLSGKIKAVVQAVAALFILILLVPYTWGVISLESLRQMSYYAVYVAAIYTVISGAEYIWANWVYIKKTLERV